MTSLSPAGGAIHEPVAPLRACVWAQVTGAVRHVNNPGSLRCRLVSGSSFVVYPVTLLNLSLKRHPL